MLKRLGLHWADVVLFLAFALVFAAFGVYWSLYMAGEPGPLQAKKDLMYYVLWVCAMGYAVLANTFVLWNKAPRGGLITFVVLLGVIVGLFFALTYLTQVLRDNISPSTKILSISIGDLLVLLPVVSAATLFIIAWIVAGFANHLRYQPVVRGLIRLGMALMLMPLVQFIVIFFLPRWDDETRGVVFLYSMGLGLMWGLFLAGALGSNLLRSNNGNEQIAVPAR